MYERCFINVKSEMLSIINSSVYLSIIVKKNCIFTLRDYKTENKDFDIFKTHGGEQCQQSAGDNTVFCLYKHVFFLIKKLQYIPPQQIIALPRKKYLLTFQPSGKQRLELLCSISKFSNFILNNEESLNNSINYVGNKERVRNTESNTQN